MIEEVLAAVFGVILIALSLIIILGFSYLYNKDKDKRKLMFIVAFFFVLPSYTTWIQPALKENYSVQSFLQWAPLPIISATFITALSATFNWKEFNKPFKGFVGTLLTSILMAVLPFPAEYLLYTVLIQFSSLILIGLLAYLVLKR